MSPNVCLSFQSLEKNIFEKRIIFSVSQDICSSVAYIKTHILLFRVTAKFHGQNARFSPVNNETCVERDVHELCNGDRPRSRGGHDTETIHGEPYKNMSVMGRDATRYSPTPPEVQVHQKCPNAW